MDDRYHEYEEFVAIPTQYLIANIDVLGVKNKLLKIDEKERAVELSKLNYFIEKAKNGNEATKALIDQGLETICFSDNIVIAYNINLAINQKDLNTKCAILLLYVMSLQAEALSQNFLLRGSIKFGELFIDKNKNFICGKGLVETYIQENELANYPRIITTDIELLKMVKDIVLDNNITLREIFKKDFDNIYYLDYLQLLTITPELTDDIMQKVKNRYEQDMSSERVLNEKIKQKHDWHVNYFNSFCDRVNLPEYKIEVNND